MQTLLWCSQDSSSQDQDQDLDLQDQDQDFQVKDQNQDQYSRPKISN